ncbi:MAG: glycosyltransferase [Planctomycetes bacterium]|nr:glycosyltransferase [Planctomycetota bacterium]
MAEPNLQSEEFPPAPSGRSGWPWETPVEGSSVRPAPAGDWPAICIVTPSLNQAAFLEQAIRSVLLQNYPHLQYVVMDGGSADGSVETIRRYERHLHFWHSGPDHGQSEAVNAGLGHCTGQIFNWLNADDMLASGALWSVARAWRKRPGAIIAGDVIDLHPDGRAVRKSQHELTARNLVFHRLSDGRHLVCHQPGIFLPLETVRSVGLLRENLHYKMDHELLLRLLPVCPAARIADLLAYFRLHRGGKTSQAPYAEPLEWAGVLEKLAAPPPGVTACQVRQARARMLVSAAAGALLAGRFIQAAQTFAAALAVAPGAAIEKIAEPRTFRMVGDRLKKPPAELL